MTNQEIIQGLKAHLDTDIGCDNCPLNGIPMCFAWLINETIAKLEQQENTKGGEDNG